MGTRSAEEMFCDALLHNRCAIPTRGTHASALVEALEMHSGPAAQRTKPLPDSRGASTSGYDPTPVSSYSGSTDGISRRSLDDEDQTIDQELIGFRAIQEKCREGWQIMLKNGRGDYTIEHVWEHYRELVEYVEKMVA